MIFVTSGTIGSDQIVEKIDEIAPRLKDTVFVTIGRGKYIPKNCQWVRYTSSITDYFRKANLIITHGGAATLFECLSLKKRIIAVPQKHTDDQTDIVNKLSEDGYIIKCENLDELEKYVKTRRKLKKYSRPANNIAGKITQFLRHDTHTKELKM